MPNYAESASDEEKYKIDVYCNLADLWDHLAEASGKPVAEVMSAWTLKLGYPVLSVEGKQVYIISVKAHHHAS